MSYGADTYCLTGLRTGRLVTGVMLVAQAVYRRLSTPRGTLQGGADEANYGLDLSAYVGDIGPEAAARVLPGLIRGELLKDERIADVKSAVTTSYNNDGTADLEVEINCALVDSADTFALTLGVDETSVELLGVAV